jgi:hypothetical protein|tara:strand:- start:887 stop:1006 length:120 start_codon:yes stop_codon:yes gene_type:complete
MAVFLLADIALAAHGSQATPSSANIGHLDIVKRLPFLMR